MNRADFMKNLADLLGDMSPGEREEAIQYYNDYFDDAGAENEQSVIASLGTPEQLAGAIKAGLSGSQTAGEFTEKGFSGYEQTRSNEVLNPNQPEGSSENGSNRQESNAGTAWQSGGGNNNGYDSYQNQYNGQNTASDKNDKKPMSAGSIVLLIILCIFAFPLVLGVGTGLFGGIIGLLGGLLGCVIGFGAAAIALILVGVCLFVYSIGLLFSVPLGGLCMMGAAMICMSLGILFTWLIVMICGKLIPAMIRGVVKLFQSIFHRGGAAA